MKAKTAPSTLSQLLRVAGPALWQGLAYEKTAYRSIEELIEIVGDLPLSEVNTVTLDDWRRALTVAPATVNRKLTNIHSVLQYAHDRGWIETLPKSKWNREPEGRVRWLTATEEQTLFGLLAEWQEAEAARFVRVLVETGMRREECLSLTPEQIDGDWIRLWKTKTKTARSVPLSLAAKEALQGFTGWNLTESRIRTIWDKLKRAMRLEHDDDFVLHCLRHTAATRTLQKTSNLKVVQRLLGHAKITTTTRYAHLSDDDLLAAVR